MKSILIEPKIHDELAEFYSLWRDACLGKKGSEVSEVKFLLDILTDSPNIKNVIDLGGGVGVHAIALTKLGYNVTLLDKASNALAIAKRTYPELKIVQSSFESIQLHKNFDAGFSILSSASYLLEEAGREAFYDWVKTHINNVMIFDQINPSRLAKIHSDNCQAEDKHFRFNVLREWRFEEDILHTSFVYEFIDKASGATKIINDNQMQKLLTVDELIKYMGKEWRIIALLGECDLKQPFDQENSARMVTVFKRL